MSVRVTLDQVRDALERFGGHGYLITVADDGRPHSVAVRIEWDGDRLVTAAGATTRTNAAARPLVTLLCPPSSPGDYSLIIDAVILGSEATATSGRLAMRPERAVLHRPAPSPDQPPPGVTDTGAPTARSSPQAGCQADCVPLYRTDSPE